MTTLAWNCRGLGIPLSVQALKDLVRVEDPSLVFIMETKASLSQMKKHKNKINQHLQALIVPSDGKSGGLALLWKENCDVRVQSYSHSHIDAIVHDTGLQITWRATGFYGHPDVAQRSSSWKLLEVLNSQFDLPWVVFGDFNEITHIEEKCGGAERDANQMEAFRNALDSCGLRDLGFVGQRYTWCNGRIGDQRTLVRLDRMVANNKWTELFQHAKVCHKSMSSSDHCLLALYPIPLQRRHHGKHQFRFESMWTRDERCWEVVEQAWVEASLTNENCSTQDRIKNCQHQLQWWNKNIFGNLKKQIKEKQTSLQCLENRNTLHEDAVNIRNLRREINELLERESAMWKQRSKSFWYQSGDRNTRFFHTVASQRRQKNRISGLEDANGVYQGHEEHIQGIILNYFSSIYQSDLPSQFDPVTDAVERRVTDEMNNLLLQEFRPEEVRNALFQMHPTKSPGPDEGLSAMLRKEEGCGNIKGVSICRGAPRLSHLFFADDSIIFCRASMGECQRVWDVLKAYEAASGQRINKDKTSLFFSKNTEASVQAEIKGLFGAQVIKQHERYLGLPSLIGRGKKKAFNRIKDQLSRKIAGWKGKLLSSAGKEVLIKAVAQATPTFTMSCFKLPDSLCKELSSLICKFWWGQKSDERKISWISWDKMCRSKDVGGMGFRDLKAFNLALLAKQGWRLLQNTNSLFHHVFQAKYFAGRSFLDAQLGNRPSFVWRSIFAAKGVVEDGMRWSVGNGDKVEIWNDKWLPNPETHRIMTPINPLMHNTKVSALIDIERAVWKSELVSSTFLPHEAATILAIPLSSALPEDRRVWSSTANGVFSVRSAYHVSLKHLSKLNEAECSNNSNMKSLWRSIWKLHCPNKIRNFIWRGCKDILPTKTKLRDRKIAVDVDCDLCGGVETAGHVFWSCEFAAAVWQMANIKVPNLMNNPSNFIDLFWSISESLTGQGIEAFATTAWFLWNNRNAVRHGEVSRTALQIFEASKHYLADFQAHCTPPEVHHPHAPISWKPPPPGWYKTNVDAAVFKERRQCGIGVVVRNEKGQIMGALSKVIPYPLGALEAEAKAAEIGIAFTWELGLREIILEGDSQSVVNAIASHDPGPIQIQHIVNGIKSWAPQFRAWKTSFTRREGNRAAHLMAKYAKQITDCTIWVEDTPPMIVSQTLNDVSVLGVSPVQ